VVTAHRSACLHAARASLAEIRICEQELAALDDIARLTSALNYRIERRREYLEEQAEIDERTRLRERPGASLRRPQGCGRRCEGACRVRERG
jgi:hypothetical protein